MTVAAMWGDTFRSLRVRNFRLFFVGQFISQSGTWMTMIAQTLLLLDLTGSGVMLGILAACQFGPVLVLGAWAGAIADRVDKRRLLFMTQTGAMLQSFVFGLVVISDNVTVGRVLALAAVQGVLTAFDNPVRRSFVTEMVPTEHVANAVSLNSAIMTGSRVVGPALAGILIGAFGYAWCFFLDSFSYLAVLGGIAMMRPAELFPSVKAERARGQVRAGLRYVRSNQDLFVPMVMMAIIGTLAFNFSVSTPLLITGGLGGSQQAFTLFFSCMSLGALVVALATARRREIPRSHLVVSAWVFGGAMCALAASPTLWVVYPIGFLVGMGSVGFMTSCNAILQLQAAPAFRGRVLALQAMVFLGSTPIGGPIIGWAGDTLGNRAPVLIGGLACFAAAAWGHLAWRRRNPIPVEPTVSPAEVFGGGAR
ncbi:MAG TPA: MFS transporter [Acidimicrobiia bacterium]|nr:MFS transporter [Acidimicrobiia bacterium]